VVALAKLDRALRVLGYDLQTVVLHSVETSRAFLAQERVSATHWNCYRRPDSLNRYLARYAQRPVTKHILLAGILSLERILRLRTDYMIVRTLRHVQPVVVALNNQFDYSLNALVERLGYAGRTVLHARGICPYTNLRRLRHPPLLMAISRAVAASYLDAGWPKDRVEVIYDPVAMYPPPPPPLDWPDLSQGKPVVAMVGSLQTWKGQVVFVDAAAKLAARYPNVNFIVVGGETLAEPDYPRSLAALIRDLGLTGRVRITGWRSDVDAIVAAATIVVHASIRPEPFGYVVPEALRFGIPVIAANAGGPTELIRDGVDGLLTEPGNAQALADAVMRLLGSESLCRELGRQGQCRVRELLSEDAFARRLGEVYARLLRQ
jgi:glycosyltransferase involved in cell wall biosynthesis